MSFDALDSRALRHFLAVVRTGSIRAAAEHINIAPSAVSRQIADIEHRLGLPIFERTARGVILTEAGQLLSEHAKRMLEDEELLREQLDHLKGVRQGLVRICCGEGFVADMIANGYHRTMPCPFQSQGLLLNPNGDLHYCENSQKLGNVLDATAESLYFDKANLTHRQYLKTDVCPTCLSPCQVNVGAMKQFVPYAKFLKRAYDVKRHPERHLDTLPAAR